SPVVPPAGVAPRIEEETLRAPRRPATGLPIRSQTAAEKVEEPRTESLEPNRREVIPFQVRARVPEGVRAELGARNRSSKGNRKGKDKEPKMEEKALRTLKIEPSKEPRAAVNRRTSF